MTKAREPKFPEYLLCAQRNSQRNHMWEFYLACSEMAFRRQNPMNFQIQLTRPRGAVLMMRNSVGREEAKLRQFDMKRRPRLQIEGEQARFELNSAGRDAKHGPDRPSLAGQAEHATQAARADQPDAYATRDEKIFPSPRSASTATRSDLFRSAMAGVVNS